MKKILSCFLCVLVFLSFPFAAAAYSAQSMIVMEQSTLSVVEGINYNKKMPMASTTKIMTALVTLENADLSMKVTIPKEACGVEGSSMYLIRGEVLTVNDLLYGLMLTSGNDAATALAIAVSGSQSAFVELMNNKAKQLGLTSTNFTNPSGLPDDNHYTTAFELGIITSVALQNTQFLQIVGTKSIRVSYNNNAGGRLLTNHNKLLSMYEYAVGVKTGFTKKAGRCLVSAAKKDGVMLVCVTLNASDDWDDHISALDSGFSQVKYVTVARKGEIEVWLPTPDGKKVLACNPNDITAISVNDAEITKTILSEPFVYPPKAKGQTIGSVYYSLNGKVIASSPLCIQDALDIKIEKELFIIKILNFIKGLFK